MARQVCSKATDTPLNAKIKKKKKGIKQNKMKQNNKEKEKR